MKQHKARPFSRGLKLPNSLCYPCMWMAEAGEKFCKFCQCSTPGCSRPRNRGYYCFRCKKKHTESHVRMSFGELGRPRNCSSGKVSCKEGGG